MVNLLKGVVGQAGNTQETCSGNPAPVKRLPGQRVDLFSLKTRKKRKLALFTRDVLVMEDATTEKKKKKSRSTHAVWWE